MEGLPIGKEIEVIIGGEAARWKLRGDLKKLVRCPPECGAATSAKRRGDP